MRQRLHVAAAVFSLGLWLFMAVAEVWTPLHAWMHGGSIPDNDNCAVAVISHGTVDIETGHVATGEAVVWIETTRTAKFSSFSADIENLPNGRAPPVLPAAS